jgi:hypothetical protein
MSRIASSGKALVVASAAVLLAFLATPGHAVVTTVHSCPSSGNAGNHDSIFNGFRISGHNASNLHSVQLFYRASVAGTYSVSITARRNSYAGALIGTQTKSLSLSASSNQTVTWEFGDAAISPSDILFFSHTYSGGGGTPQYNLQLNDCPGNIVNAGTSNINNGFSVATTITSNVGGGGGGTPCVANATTLCLDDQPGDKRFQVRLNYATSAGGGLSGPGKATQLNTLGVTQGGLFWFFSLSNPEVLVKVLNGCSTNSRYWVFLTAGTNIGFTATVTDTVTGKTASYTNPDNTAARPVQDTSSPLTCN